ncbi:winged helix DNA-binding domain-containing protein [Streptomyces sp. NPDC048111]|uniref:winged helix DNA-binding domain-containing protein n=1 Tax=Streptomyces sp. NPDC048111 TaxID=3365500 RepID=UPI0037157A2A
MKISERELNRATLSRQLLLERASLSLPDAMRQLVALQAQHPASPYIALWNRLEDFDPAALDEAFARRSVVKATLMRITLHAVLAEDYPGFRAALRPTLYASRLGYRYAAAGLTPADADELIPELLEFAQQPRTMAEMKTWIEGRLGAERLEGGWWGLRAYAPLHHAPTGGAWSFGYRPSFIAATADDPRPAPAGPEPDLDALRALIVRYLTGFGPASVADIAQFAMVRRTAVREALRALDDTVEHLQGPDGSALLDLPGAPRPSADTPAPPRLIGMWDSVLLAHAERGRVIPAAHRATVIRTNGDVLPTLLVDGFVAGVWRPTDKGIEVTAFERLPRATWDALADEARSLTHLLAAREAMPYSRHHHWWAKLPKGGTVRLLPPAR